MHTHKHIQGVAALDHAGSLASLGRPAFTCKLLIHHGDGLAVRNEEVVILNLILLGIVAPSLLLLDRAKRPFVLLRLRVGPYAWQEETIVRLRVRLGVLEV